MCKLLPAVLFLVHLAASAQSFTYELYQVGNAERKLLSAESVNYDSAKVRSTKQAGQSVVRRELVLGSGFAVGCTDYGEKQPKGFGCWVSQVRSQVSLDQYDGFSWEWYDQGVGALYAKRQGGTKASLKVMQAQQGFAMESLEFLEDTVFQVNVKSKGQPGEFTHELIIRRGSTLVFKERLPE